MYFPRRLTSIMDPISAAIIKPLQLAVAQSLLLQLAPLLHIMADYAAVNRAQNSYSFEELAQIKFENFCFLSSWSIGCYRNTNGVTTAIATRII